MAGCCLCIQWGPEVAVGLAALESGKNMGSRVGEQHRAWKRWNYEHRPGFALSLHFLSHLDNAGHLQKLGKVTPGTHSKLAAQRI